MSDINYQSVFDKEGELIKFHDASNILVTSDKPLKHEFNDKDIPFIEIPNLYPVKHTVTLNPEHFYSDNSKYRKLFFNKKKTAAHSILYTAR